MEIPMQKKTSEYERFMALSDAQKTESIERTFRGDRQRIREWASQQALDLIRRRLR